MDLNEEDIINLNGFDLNSEISNIQKIILQDISLISNMSPDAQDQKLKGKQSTISNEHIPISIPDLLSFFEPERPAKAGLHNNLAMSSNLEHSNQNPTLSNSRIRKEKEDDVTLHSLELSKVRNSYSRLKLPTISKFSMEKCLKEIQFVLAPESNSKEHESSKEPDIKKESLGVEIKEKRTRKIDKEDGITEYFPPKKIPRLESPKVKGSSSNSIQKSSPLKNFVFGSFEACHKSTDISTELNKLSVFEGSDSMKNQYKQDKTVSSSSTKLKLPSVKTMRQDCLFISSMKNSKRNDPYSTHCDVFSLDKVNETKFD